MSDWYDRGPLRGFVHDSSRAPGLYMYVIHSAYDRDSALHRFHERFKEDPDISRVRIVRVESWKRSENVFEKDFAIFYRLDSDGSAFIRPTCPECGNSHVISKGSSWLCRGCGRWFSNTYRRKKEVKKDLVHIFIKKARVKGM